MAHHKVALTDDEILKHLNVMCSNLFENLEMYLGRITKDSAKKFQIAEMVLVNALAKHVAACEPHMTWQGKFATQAEFEVDFLNHILTKVCEATGYMRVQRDQPGAGRRGV